MKVSNRMSGFYVAKCAQTFHTQSAKKEMQQWLIAAAMIAASLAVCYAVVSSYAK